MTLRRRLFLLLGGLVCLLLVGQWLLFRSLTRAVTDDVRTLAFRVGEEILSGFTYRTLDSDASAGASAAVTGEATAGGGAEATGIVVVTSGDPDPAEPGESAAAIAGAATGRSAAAAPRRVVVQQELRYKRADGTETTFERQFEPGEGLPPGVPDSPGTPGPAGSILRKMVLETDAARDVLFVHGPAMKRAIPIPHAAIASTLDRFGSELLLGNLALLAIGLAAVAVVTHRLTRPLAGLTEAAERLGSGELGAAVAVERDDEIGRASAAFNRMSQRLAELDRENRRLAAAEHLSELGEVARGLAHSLRNPLNALGLALEQVGAPGEVVEGGRRQIRRMDGALRSFLALASAGSAQAEPVDLVQLAREVALEALQDSTGRVRIEVEVSPSAVTPSTAGPGLAVAGVTAELKAALQALVVNAVEASAPGAQVTIRLDRADDGRATIVIDDEGSGLPESVRARLFEPHVSTKPHGSGMGLFLAHRLISGRYAGALRLEPRATAGTRATIEVGPRVGERSR